MKNENWILLGVGGYLLLNAAKKIPGEAIAGIESAISNAVSNIGSAISGEANQIAHIPVELIREVLPSQVQNTATKILDTAVADTTSVVSDLYNAPTLIYSAVEKEATTPGIAQDLLHSIATLGGAAPIIGDIYVGGSEESKGVIQDVAHTIATVGGLFPIAADTYSPSSNVSVATVVPPVEVNRSRIAKISGTQIAPMNPSFSSVPTQSASVLQNAIAAVTSTNVPKTSQAVCVAPSPATADLITSGLNLYSPGSYVQTSFGPIKVG